MNVMQLELLKKLARGPPKDSAISEYNQAKVMGYMWDYLFDEQAAE